MTEPFDPKPYKPPRKKAKTAGEHATSGETGQALAVGRIVHYAHRDGACTVAIVTRVVMGDICNLTLFNDLAPVSTARDVPYDPAGLRGTWHWPERV